ncbi:hypothetical protein LEP3755_30590 [Leptolyngbya sp. NIES-3755]|nr:hypothetical protein LEP3755_30590 [Leptolyngbya sp. NIES-3755]
MFRYSAIEWYELQKRFIREPETVSIRDYSFEVTGDDSYPLWEALEEKYREQEWDLIRDYHRTNAGEEVTIENSSAVKSALADVERVSNPLRAIARTIKFSQNVQSNVERALERAFLALESTSFGLESPADISKVLKDLAGIYQTMNGLERQVLGIKDPAELLKTSTDNDNEMTIDELSEHLTELGDQEIVMFLSELQKSND